MTAIFNKYSINNLENHLSECAILKTCDICHHDCPTAHREPWPPSEFPVILILISWSTSSCQQNFGLPAFLFSIGLVFNIRCAIHSFQMYLSRSILMFLTTSSPSYRLYNSKLYQLFIYISISTSPYFIFFCEAKYFPKNLSFKLALIRFGQFSFQKCVNIGLNKVL